MVLKYFKPETDPLMIGVDDRVMTMLDIAHEFSSAELDRCRYVITSGKRSPGGNSILKGAVADSSHLSGLAVDLLVSDDVAYAAMLIGLAKAGFKRFGFYYVVDPKDPYTGIPMHIHVDIDVTKPTPCIWTKREQN